MLERKPSMEEQEYQTSLHKAFHSFSQNNIKLIEMITVYFNTILDGYSQDQLGSSDCFSSFTVKKIVSGEVL